MPAELTPGTRISTTGGFDRGSSTASGLHTAGTEADLCSWRFQDVLIPRTLREPLRNARCGGKAVEARGPRAASRRWPRSDAAPPTALASLVWSWRLGLCSAFPTPAPPFSRERCVHRHAQGSVRTARLPALSPGRAAGPRLWVSVLLFLVAASPERHLDARTF